MACVFRWIKNGEIYIYELVSLIEQDSEIHMLLRHFDKKFTADYPSGASPDGVMDMAGDVSDWVADNFLPYTGSNAPDDMFWAKALKKPKGSETTLVGAGGNMVDFVNTDQRYKVLRGGSWKSDPFSTSTYHRNFSWPEFASAYFGFRCAQDVKN